MKQSLSVQGEEGRFDKVGIPLVWEYVMGVGSGERLRQIRWLLDLPAEVGFSSLFFSPTICR